MIQFIHVYLNITILYQGDAMQISNLVSQYNNSVANGEPMTGAKGVEKLVSSLNEMSKGMIFEGTVSSVRGNQVKLALSNGQQILARLAGKFSFEQGQSVFFQVKNNDGGTIEIKPYTVDGEGANLTLMDALKAAGLSVDGINLSMVNKMMSGICSAEFSCQKSDSCCARTYFWSLVSKSTSCFTIRVRSPTEAQ